MIPAAYYIPLPILHGSINMQIPLMENSPRLPARTRCTRVFVNRRIIEKEKERKKKGEEEGMDGRSVKMIWKTRPGPFNGGQQRRPLKRWWK